MCTEVVNPNLKTEQANETWDELENNFLESFTENMYQITR
jgi:hypothetical protein